MGCITSRTELKTAVDLKRDHLDELETTIEGRVRRRKASRAELLAVRAAIRAVKDQKQ